MGAIVEMKAVVKNYTVGKQEVPALRGVDLVVGAGEFTSIAGPSGSGKTTLLNLLGCLDVPSAGSVLIEGEEVAAKTRDELSELRRHKISFIFQTFNLVPVLSAFENVELPLALLPEVGPAERKERVERLLALVGLADLMGRRPIELSGGQQQRIAIARALIKKPRLILADEPSANLDSDNGQAVLELMRRINREEGATFIFSTHDPMVMSYARRLLLLKDGRIASDEVRD